MLLLAERTDSSTRLLQSREPDVLTRIQMEFQEMPGLRLTLPQASRLFGIERNRCQQVLDSLVTSGHLASDGKTYAKSQAH